MTDSHSQLRILSPHYSDIVQANLARAARIDKLGVDRSSLHAMPPHRWSADAEAQEQKWEQYRSEVTLGQRMAAWRILFVRHKQPRAGNALTRFRLRLSFRSPIGL